MTTTKSALSFAARVGLLQAGLLDQTAVVGLISEAVASHRMHYLPKEIVAYGAELLKQGKIVIPES